MLESRVFALGDVHGHLEPLVELLEKVNFDFKNDKLIILGDVCDRGNETWEVIELLSKIINKIFVLGNHDYCFIEYLNGNEKYISDWGIKQGRETINSYNKNNWRNLELNRNFLENHVAYYVENNICFVHGSFNRNIPIINQSKLSLCHDRDLAYYTVSSKEEKIKTYDNFDKIFIGHTTTICWDEEDLIHFNPNKIVLSIKNPIYSPIIKAGVHLIDTGCGKGGHLTLFDVTNNIYYQSSKKY